VTRWKTILRSGEMQSLTLQSKAALVEYGVRTVVDLRRDIELEERPNVFADSPGIAYHHHDIWGDLIEPDRSDYDDASVFWLGHYRMLLDERRSQVCDAVATVADPDNWPVVFHCAAGKDRTGVVAGLVLSLAGVPSAIIAEDYALSARFLLDRFLAVTPPEEIPVGFGWREYQREHCPLGAMRKTLKHVESVYGGVEGYLAGGGVSQAQVASLRSAFLE
jgi:protein-tyrosine phosphatase